MYIIDIVHLVGNRTVSDDVHKYIIPDIC